MKCEPAAEHVHEHMQNGQQHLRSCLPQRTACPAGKRHCTTSLRQETTSTIQYRPPTAMSGFVPRVDQCKLVALDPCYIHVAFDHTVQESA